MQRQSLGDLYNYSKHEFGLLEEDVMKTMLEAFKKSHMYENESGRDEGDGVQLAAQRGFV